MNFLQVLKLFITFAPAGITLTKDVIAVVENIVTGINAAPQQANHTAAVAALAAAADKVNIPTTPAQ